MKSRLTSAAASELSDALEYYASIDHSLAVRFLREFENTKDRLVQFPQIGNPRCDGIYRTATIRGFPYGIAYTFSTDSTVIHGVIHYKRGPNRWQNIP